MRRTLAAVAATLVMVSLVAACGSEDKSASRSSGPKTIQVTIKGDSVTPNGDRVQVAVGQDVELDVTADKAGEIHVHSEPEQELEYQAGESTLTIKGIDKPGTVDVESHSLDKVIVQLQVQ